VGRLERKLNLLVITGSLAIISFALNAITAYRDSVADFYSPQTRFWELLIGAGLAYADLHQKSRLAHWNRRSRKEAADLSLHLLGYWAACG
jgi:peptidoglycan/LPS O-acetylase OafA/YrhL